ncbi:class I SAM-dependent methyltransferase [Lysobacter korlensis]|uniref:Class I SAM-dependent methyltransferase n=1 Tax=Lysobacter korlensis TaxID=553636 RepID=A0ABV6RLN0_9GAMM
MGFFNRYARFLDTSRTSPYPHRLNGRHTAIIERNRALLAGKRVLDIASHDGRWSFAALEAGAAHVTGVEPRAELIENARQTLSHYGVADNRASFFQADVFDYLQGPQFDVVLCLGFFYHTLRHAELLDLIERTGARFVVIDTEICPDSGGQTAAQGNDPRAVFGNPNQIQMFREPVADQQMAWVDSLTRSGQTLVGRPSRGAIEYMAHHFGYSCSRYEWPKHFDQKPEHSEWMVDYREGWRETFYLEK